MGSFCGWHHKMCSCSCKPTCLLGNPLQSKGKNADSVDVAFQVVVNYSIICSFRRSLARSNATRSCDGLELFVIAWRLLSDDNHKSPPPPTPPLLRNILAAQCQSEPNIVYNDYDLWGKYTSSADDCCTLCGTNLDCTAWSWRTTDGYCFLKSSTTGRASDGYFVSGIRGGVPLGSGLLLTPAVPFTV